MIKTKRSLKHKEYYKIKGYQILAKKSDEEMAKALNISKRTYTDKVNGYSDFSSEQGRKIAFILGVSQDEIFLD